MGIKKKDKRRREARRNMFGRSVGGETKRPDRAPRTIEMDSGAFVERYEALLESGEYDAARRSEQILAMKAVLEAESGVSVSYLLCGRIYRQATSTSARGRQSVADVVRGDYGVLLGIRVVLL